MGSLLQQASAATGPFQAAHATPFQQGDFTNRVKGRSAGSPSTAVSPDNLGRDDGITEAGVHVVDEIPRTPVRNAEGPAGLRDRTGLVDSFEQTDLARPQSAGRCRNPPLGQAQQ
jgi:hypothetical protein